MPGNKRSRVGTKPNYRFGQFFGPPHAPDGLGREVELLARWQFCDDLFDPWGTEDAWADGVDADSSAAVLVRPTTVIEDCFWYPSRAA